jgi:hypothetical protein
MLDGYGGIEVQRDGFVIAPVVPLPRNATRLSFRRAYYAGARFDFSFNATHVELSQCADSPLPPLFVTQQSTGRSAELPTAPSCLTLPMGRFTLTVE